ncbi:MAG: hypothetical protein LBK99_07065 [Opitutaceae bacterium]|jgi:hypothetical protein|nr:hypothetical protein [Opitutaceae bacterium]
MNVIAKKPFQPDYTNIVKVLHNERPACLPLYEHHIDSPFISRALGRELLLPADAPGLRDYFGTIINFWKNNTYDAFDYEAPVCSIFPDHGAIMGGRKGPIQNRADFEAFPWEEIPALFKRTYAPQLDAIRDVLPAGMKAYGGCGYGIFEASEDLVGYEPLCLLTCDEPELVGDLYAKIGDLYVRLWTWMLEHYGDLFVFCRMGDDLGFASSMLLPPEVVRTHIIPQHKRIVDLVHSHGKKFLLHSCGHIFPVMEDFINTVGIDAKHSNEDKIAPYDEWIAKYGSRIGLFGGIDMNHLILQKPDEVFEFVVQEGTRFRKAAKGYGLGSGNSIPDYVPVENFYAMIEAAKHIRASE